MQLCETPLDVEFMDKLPAVSFGFPCKYFLNKLFLNSN